MSDNELNNCPTFGGNKIMFLSVSFPKMIEEIFTIYNTCIVVTLYNCMFSQKSVLSFLHCHC